MLPTCAGTHSLLASRVSDGLGHDYLQFYSAEIAYYELVETSPFPSSVSPICFYFLFCFEPLTAKDTVTL